MSLDSQLILYFMEKSTRQLFKIWDSYTSDEISEIIHRVSHNAAYQAQNLSDERHEHDVYLSLAVFMGMKKVVEQTDYLKKIVLDSQRTLEMDVVPVKYDVTGRLGEKELAKYQTELKQAVKELEK